MSTKQYIIILILFLISIASCVNAGTSIPNNFFFERDLRPGSSVYPDINYLQDFLNLDERTAVATSGPGSIGQLTSFFGEKTRDAVMRFQLIYAQEILIPVGLAQPTGYFGARTRIKANSILAEMREPGRNATSTQSATSTTNNLTPTSTPTSSNGGGGSGSSAAGIGVGIGTSLIGGLLSGSSGGSGSGGSGVMNFGGKVTRVTYCTCSGSVMLDINDVRGQFISLIYMPGVSRLYMYYNVYASSGQDVLGTYTPGGQCMVYHGEDCTPEGMPRGVIQMIGTSR